MVDEVNFGSIFPTGVVEITQEHAYANEGHNMDIAEIVEEDVKTTGAEMAIEDVGEAVKTNDLFITKMAADDVAQTEAYLQSFPPGYRFAPRDDELIEHYLECKITDRSLPINKFRDVNIYKFNPQDLAMMYNGYGNREKEWYFFTPRDRKYPNGNRPNRAAGNGYWKATGADKEIYSRATTLTIGYRKALVFYEGKPPRGIKTKWIMHEYRINSESPRGKKIGVHGMRLDDWVLCRIYQKSNGPNAKGTKIKKNVLAPTAEDMFCSNPVSASPSDSNEYSPESDGVLFDEDELNMLYRTFDGSFASTDAILMQYDISPLDTVNNGEENATQAR